MRFFIVPEHLGVLTLWAEIIPFDRLGNADQEKLFVSPAYA